MNPNAEAVVRTWVDAVGDGHWRRAWGTAAHDKTPSYLNALAASVHRKVSRAADEAADELIAAGFLPGHATVLSLRGVASTHAAEASRTEAWSRDLARVERAFDAAQRLNAWAEENLDA